VKVFFLNSRQFLQVQVVEEELDVVVVWEEIGHVCVPYGQLSVVSGQLLGQLSLVSGLPWRTLSGCRSHGPNRRQIGIQRWRQFIDHRLQNSHVLSSHQLATIGASQKVLRFIQ
jgi:hypothetical protein